METSKYFKLWEHLRPAMQREIDHIETELRSVLPEGFSLLKHEDEMADNGGRVTLDVLKQGTFVLGLDYELRDGEMYDGADGVNVALSIIGYSGLALGGYFPANYTADCWTSDAEVLMARVKALPDALMVTNHVLECFKNEALRKELAQEGVSL